MARTKQTARKSYRGQLPAKKRIATTLPGIRGLMENLFEEPTATYQARFALAKCPSTDETPSTAEFCHHEAIAHDCVLSFLGPHEILSLLRTSKGTWEAAGPRRRRFAILRSVFAYLRISEEAAQSVRGNFRGGWRSFAPVLVGMCEHLARVYGHLEPDPAHRAILAEQACFVDGFGTLVAHELFRKCPFLLGDQDGKSDDVIASARAPLTLDSLKNVGSRSICWGDLGPCITGYSDDRMGDWLARNLTWMREHASGTNEHYRRRLEIGLHPPIWIMYDTGSEPVEWALGIGPCREQFMDVISSYYDLSSWEDTREGFTESFWFCFQKDNISARNSLVAFLVDFVCSPEPMHEPTPTLSVAIWCMRHGLQPFTDKSIDWAALIAHESKQGGDIDPGFLTEAVTSPFFGPADVDKYKE